MPIALSQENFLLLPTLVRLPLVNSSQSMVRPYVHKSTTSGDSTMHDHKNLAASKEQSQVAGPLRVKQPPLPLIKAQ